VQVSLSEGAYNMYAATSDKLDQNYETEDSRSHVNPIHDYFSYGIRFGAKARQKL
jgi:hypothetical protein